MNDVLGSSTPYKPSVDVEHKYFDEGTNDEIG